MEIKPGGSRPSARAPAEHSIQGSLDGDNIEWLEKVTDDQYQGARERER